MVAVGLPLVQAVQKPSWTHELRSEALLELPAHRNASLLGH